MSLIATAVMAGGTILFKFIIIFLVAIPTGMGLGVGLYAVKRFFKRWERKKIPSTEGRAERHKDALTNLEQNMAVVGSEA